MDNPFKAAKVKPAVSPTPPPSEPSPAQIAPPSKPVEPGKVRTFKVCLPGDPPFPVEAASQEEAVQKYRDLVGITTTLHVFSCEPVD